MSLLYSDAYTIFIIAATDVVGQQELENVFWKRWPTGIPVIDFPLLLF